MTKQQQPTSLNNLLKSNQTNNIIETHKENQPKLINTLNTYGKYTKTNKILEEILVD